MINFGTSPQTGASSSTQNRKRKGPDPTPETASTSTQNKKQKKEFDHMLEVICKSRPAILQTAIDSFVRAPKGSEAAVREAAKIELALTHGSNANHSGSPVLTNLSKAIVHNRPWLFKKLLNHPKTDINLMPKVGQSAIFSAIQAGNVVAFQKLIKQNANVSHRALGLAMLCGQPEMLETLFTKMPELTDPIKESLRREAQEQQEEIEINKNLLPEERRMWLEKVSYQLSGPHKIVAMFLADGKPNASFADGNRPLHLTLLKEQGDEDRSMLINFLLNAGADPNEKNDNGDTSLLLAARENHMPALRTLLRAGADPNLANNRKETPLSWATHHYNEESIRALREAGADSNRATPIVTE